MDIKNKIPKTFIIADTKCNEQTFNSLLKEHSKEPLYKEWQENNVGEAIPDSEKIPELCRSLLDNSELSPKNQTFHASSDLSSLDIVSCTVYFKNTSIQLLQKIILQYNSVKLLKSPITANEISFWVPRLIENNKTALFEYGMMFANLGDRVNKIKATLNYDNLPSREKSRVEYEILTLLPQAVQVDFILNLTFKDWIQLIYTNTQPDKSDEERFVFLMLFKGMKFKYSNMFQCLNLVSIDGYEPFGIKSLTEENWDMFTLTG